MSRGDVHIVTGMDAIVNPDNIKPGMDLKELERQMISGGLITKRIKDPQDRFNDELKDAANKLGISFGEFSKKKPPAPAYNPVPVQKYSSMPTLDGGFPSKPEPPKYSPPEDDDESKEESDDEKEESNDDEKEESDDEKEDVSRSSYSGNRFSSDDRPRYGSDLATRTHEQERRSHIDSVMGSTDGGSSDGGGFSFEAEKKEDMKCAMLAEIDSLISVLENDDIDLSRIPKVDQNSDYAKVESTLRVLRYKNDHNRYCSFADEFLLFGAHALEELFDGKRTWFGRYQPDLTGYHNQLNVKLRRCAADKGQIVSDIMHQYNIGAGARLLLEIVPGMVLYSKLRKQQHGAPGLFSDEEMSQVTGRLRDKLD